MKKILKKLLFVTVMTMLCAVMAVTADAAYSGTCGAQGDNLTWEIDSDTATLYIRGSGNMADYSDSYNGVQAPWREHEAAFSYVVIEENVTSIGNYAFKFSYSHENKRITIGKDVYSIGVEPFDSLDNVVIDENNSYCYIENSVMFAEEGRVLACADLYKYTYTVPEGVISINDKALADVRVIVFIPSTVEYMSRNSFGGAFIFVDEDNEFFSSDEHGVVFDKDKTVLLFAPTVPDEYVNVDKYYRIPDSVTEIADYAFYGARLGERCFIPDSVTHIGSYALNTSKVYIPFSVTSVGDCFVGSTYGGMDEKYIYYKGTEQEWKLIENSDCYEDDPNEVSAKNIIFEHKHILEETTIGCKLVKQCSLCEVVTEVVTETHDWGGYREYEADCELVYAKTVSCNKCFTEKFEIILPRGEHTWVADDCCGYEVFDCEKGGTREVYCVYCDAEKTEIVPPRGEHSWFSYDCGSGGVDCEQGGLAEYECRYCDAIKTEVIEPGSHQWVYPTEEELSRYCDEFTSWVYCDKCSFGEHLEIFQGTGEHNYYKRWTELTTATCSFPGISVRGCKNCANIESRTEPAYGHFDDDEDGKCDECKVVIEIYAPNDPSIPVEPGIPDYPGQPDESHTEHTFGEWLEKGDFQYRVCSYCGYVESRIAVEGGEVEFEYPSQPDCEFEADAITGGEFLLIEINAQQTLGQNIAVLKAFDINMKDSTGVHVQPNGSVKVKLPLTWEQKGDYKVYRVNDDGTYTDMNAFRQGSHMVFETDHFSIYIITEEVDIPETPNDSPDDSCSCNCHKSGIMGFIWKIINFFQKLFRIKPTCACGVAHY